MSLDTTAAPAVEISDVFVEPPAEDLVAHLDSPASGDSMPGFWLPITGWGLSRSGAPVEVRVSDRWMGLRRFACDVHRPDIAEAFSDVSGADQAGFSFVFNATRLPHAFDLWLSGVVAGESTRFALIRGMRRTFTRVDDLPLLPLAVTTLGRTGSTLLMTLLSLHPAIFAFRPSGFDSRPLAHGLAAATAMAAPGSRMQLLDSTGAGEDWWLGSSPLAVASLERFEPRIRAALLGDPVDELLHAGLRRAAQSTRELALAEGKSGVRYAAEKCGPGYVPRLLHELSADSREVFLVRDFRDVLASILAFNAKRGYAAFGREHAGSDADFVARFAADIRMLADSWAERRERSLLVRYEDLISQPAVALEQLFAYLGLETSTAEIRAIIASAHSSLEAGRATHRTTSDPSASTGRWVEDLSPEIQEACAEAFDGPLRKFGYV